MTYSPRFGVFLLLFVFTFSSLTMAQEFATPGLSGATNKINLSYTPQYFLIIVLFYVSKFRMPKMEQDFGTLGLSGATNKINLSYTPQYFLNGINIDHDGISPDVLSTKNTGGYTLSLEYQRTTRYHMIYG